MTTHSGVAPAVARAVGALARGDPVLVFDAADREGETDLFFLAEAATPATIQRLRQDAGGLVFMALGPSVGPVLGLPFLEDVLKDAATTHPVLARLLPERLPYDAKSSFGLTVNHRAAYTGITDEDRARTVSALGRLVADLPMLSPPDAQARFAAEFRAPGHVHLCHGAADGLAERRGHTELAVALCEIAGCPPAAVGAEMLGTGRALGRAEAEAYARRHGAPFVDGAAIALAWASLKAAARDAVVTA